MPNVHASDPYVALEIVPEATYGTDPGAGYLRVPFLGETVAFSRKPVDQTREIKGFGAQATGSYGAGELSGVIRTLGYYNAPWLHLLMCHAFGGCEEIGVDGRLVDGSTGITGANSHAYLAQSFKCFTAGSVGGRPIGLTARAWKAGPNQTAGEIEVLTGLLVNSWEFTHRYNAYPEMAFGLVGNKTTRLSAVGASLAALPTGKYPIKPNGIAVNAAGALAPSLFKAGAASPVFNLTEFSVKLETPIAFPERFANDLDGDYEPAIVGNRKVTGRIGYRMNQTSLADGKPPYEFLQGTLGSKIRARYASGLMTGAPITPAIGDAGIIPYLFDIALGAVQWTEGPSNMAGPGVIEGYVGFQAYEFTYGTSGYVHATGNRKGPIYVGFSVDEADDSDAKFTATAAGGNDLDTTLR